MTVKNIRQASAFLILFLTILACSRYEKPIKQKYQKDDLTFTHLSNWTVAQDGTFVGDGFEIRQIRVKSPDDAIFILTRFPGEIPLTLEDYVQKMHKASNNEVKDATGGYQIVEVGEAKVSPAAAQFAGVARPGLTREFDMKAMGVVASHRADHYLIETGKEKWFLVAQAPKEEWDAAKEGFQTIYDGLSLDAPAAASGGTGK